MCLFVFSTNSLAASNYSYFLSSYLIFPETEILAKGAQKLLFSWATEEAEYEGLDTVVTFTASTRYIVDSAFPYLRIAGITEAIVLQTLDYFALAATHLVEAAPSQGINVTHHLMIDDESLWTYLDAPPEPTIQNVSATIQLLKEIEDIENKAIFYIGSGVWLQVNCESLRHYSLSH